MPEVHRGGLDRQPAKPQEAPLKIVGLSAFYHDAACCLLEDGRVVAAAQEERFSRVKHDPRLPVHAFRFCLDVAGVGPHEIDALGYYESPVRKLARQLWSGVQGEGEAELVWLDPSGPARLVREVLGYAGPIHCHEHHLSHAASAFFFSGFADSAILVADGVGEWATTTLAHGRGARIDILDEVEFPHSLGLLYSALTSYLGFPVNDGEGRVMGLAPWGRPRFVDRIRSLFAWRRGGRFELRMEYFDFVGGRAMYAESLSRLLGAPPRAPGAEIEPFHADVAASLQAVLEEVLLDLVHELGRRIDSTNLCLAGGVALNCVANGRILREGPFSNVWIQPAPGDAGACLGAAALTHVDLTGDRPTTHAMESTCLGPRWSSEEVESILRATGLPVEDFRGREDALLEAVVARLASGQVVGWFQGAMELGPRALGARSLLASPFDARIRDRLNSRIKGRESFRPFAPSVLSSRARELFELHHASPFMTAACRVASSRPIPAVTHVDGTARPQTVDPEQNPRFAALLEAFERRTGYPVLLNTSLNVAGEPVVCSPIDALLCMGRSDFDALVLEDFVVDRAHLPRCWGELFRSWEVRRRSAFGSPDPEEDRRLYTFV